MTLDELMPVMLVSGILMPGVAWPLTARFGVWPGLALPALVVAAAAFRSQMVPGHAEEAMARGLEMTFFWAPAVVNALICFGIGIVANRRRVAQR